MPLTPDEAALRRQVERETRRRRNAWQRANPRARGQKTPSLRDVLIRVAVLEGYGEAFAPTQADDWLAELAEQDAARRVCQTCGGDGLVVVGWNAEAYENVEGPCPDCVLDAARKDERDG